jgi:perosamine synthetase
MLGAEELTAVGRVFDSRWLGQGQETRAFEEALRRHLGVPHVVAVSSGTAALHLALEALALPRGSGVLVPSLTFVATIQAILAAGLRPVFCEVDPSTLQLDLADAATRAAASDVRVVMPVHFGGDSCNLASLRALADEWRLTIVEDAAHAFGSTCDGIPLGAMGDIGCFSFDPIKNITCGEGGAVVTRSASLADHVRAARMLGISSDGWSRHSSSAAWAYTVHAPGWRCHMPDLNAAIGLAQLERLPVLRARKQAIVRRYHEAFARLPSLTRLTRPSPEIFPFTYTVRVPAERRNDLMDRLRASGIGTSVEYIPNHLHPAFAAWASHLPMTERVFDQIVSLPLYAELTDDDVTRVIEAVAGILGPGDHS